MGEIVLSWELCKSTFWGLATVAGIATTAKTTVIDHLTAASNASWSMYNLAKVGHAGLVYAADNDDVLAFAPGNYAFSQAVDNGGGCVSIGLEFRPGCKPINVLLQGYGTNWTTFVSPADACTLNGKTTTWHEATATVYPGASYEYFWHPSFATKPLNEVDNAKEQPMFVSMFEVETQDGPRNQVVYMDGHIGTDTRDHLASIPAPQ